MSSHRQNSTSLSKTQQRPRRSAQHQPIRMRRRHSTRHSPQGLEAAPGRHQRPRRPRSTRTCQHLAPAVREGIRLRRRARKQQPLPLRPPSTLLSPLPVPLRRTRGLPRPQVMTKMVPLVQRLVTQRRPPRRLPSDRSRRSALVSGCASSSRGGIPARKLPKLPIPLWPDRSWLDVTVLGVLSDILQGLRSYTDHFTLYRKCGILRRQGGLGKSAIGLLKRARIWVAGGFACPVYYFSGLLLLRPCSYYDSVEYHVHDCFLGTLSTNL